jgi:Protein of unknown function (DUF3175)
MAATTVKKRSSKHRTAARKTSAASPRRGKKQTRRYWSARVTRESDALTLDKGVFKLHDPKKIAASLKRSAERSRRRKTGSFRSALSMLTFYINRAGKNLPQSRKRTLMRAKDELRKQYGKAAS